MTVSLHLAALVAYSAATALLFVSLVRTSVRLPDYATGIVALGLALHLGGLASYATDFGELPLQGLGPVLSSLALLIAGGSVVFAVLSRTGPLGIVLTPVAALAVAAALLTGLRPGDEATGGFWFVLHVVLSTVGYAALTVAFAAGLMYLLQFRQLKDKHFGAVFRFFPPLQTLDRIGGTSLWTGFAALSAGLLLGATVAGAGDPAAVGNPHLLWGVLTWLVFGGALLARAGRGRAGFRGALASVVGFVIVVFAYLLLRTQFSGGGVFL